MLLCLTYLNSSFVSESLWTEPFLNSSVPAAVSAHHSGIDGSPVFLHALVKRFLRGLVHVYPLVRSPPPVWDLPLVLRRLTRNPFEPLVSCDLRLLMWKTAFLVAITSARWVSELVALCRNPPCLFFQPHSVRLQPDLTFLPKIVSKFHLSADVILPDFSRLLHRAGNVCYTCLMLSVLFCSIWTGLNCL